MRRLQKKFTTGRDCYEEENWENERCAASDVCIVSDSVWHRTTTSVFYTQESAFMNKPVLFVYRKKKEYKKMSRAKNPKYESMSLEELKANMEKSRQELEAAIHHKNILEQRKKLVERRERSHRLIVKGAEFEKVFPLSRDLEQEDVQDMMNQLQNSSYNKSIVRQAHIAALHKDQQQIAEAVKKTEKGDDS